MLSICLRGEAQKLLSGLTVYQLCNYGTLKSILADRYDPKEKEVTYRCQFRYRRREKGESVSDYGYELNKLAQKAYPNLTLSQLEVHVIDQFINGLGSHELQKHVQFRHPKALHEAIGLAFCCFYFSPLHGQMLLYFLHVLSIFQISILIRKLIKRINKFTIRNYFTVNFMVILHCF